MKRSGHPSQGRTSVFAGLAGTVAIHGSVLALLFAAVKPPVLAPPVYAVQLVAAPKPMPLAKPAPEVLERPPAEPAPAPVPTKPTPAKPQPKPVPKPPPTRTPPVERPREPTPRASSTVTPAPGETPSTGSDVATVKTPGLEFPFPEYLRSIVQEVYRRWDRPSGNSAMRAEVSFFILRDGAVKDIRFSTRSGSFSFDLSAQGAIEAAGNAHAFGPLPEGYEADVLPVTFFFTPRVGP
ncbi:MAG: TonB C-terminal domain-containing protein [Gemmatimonadota bacterium]